MDRDGARFTLCTTVRSLHLAETGHGGVRVPCVRFAWPLHLADNRVTTRAPVWVWTLALAFELVLVPNDYHAAPAESTRVGPRFEGACAGSLADTFWDPRGFNHLLCVCL